jgi:hypothetical protein
MQENLRVEREANGICPMFCVGFGVIDQAPVGRVGIEAKPVGRAEIPTRARVREDTPR